jgi:hypothetical protein
MSDFVIKEIDLAEQASTMRLEYPKKEGLTKLS